MVIDDYLASEFSGRTFVVRHWDGECGQDERVEVVGFDNPAASVTVQYADNSQQVWALASFLDAVQEEVVPTGYVYLGDLLGSVPSGHKTEPCRF